MSLLGARWTGASEKLHIKLVNEAPSHVSLASSFASENRTRFSDIFETSRATTNILCNTPLVGDETYQHVGKPPFLLDISNSSTCGNLYVTLCAGYCFCLLFSVYYWVRSDSYYCFWYLFRSCELYCQTTITIALNSNIYFLEHLSNNVY